VPNVTSTSPALWSVHPVVSVWQLTEARIVFVTNSASNLWAPHSASTINILVKTRSSFHNIMFVVLSVRACIAPPTHRQLPYFCHALAGTSYTPVGPLIARLPDNLLYWSSSFLLFQGLSNQEETNTNLGSAKTKNKQRLRARCTSWTKWLTERSCNSPLRFQDQDQYQEFKEQDQDRDQESKQLSLETSRDQDLSL